MVPDGDCCTDDAFEGAEDGVINGLLIIEEVLVDKALDPGTLSVLVKLVPVDTMTVKAVELAADSDVATANKS